VLLETLGRERLRGEADADRADRDRELERGEAGVGERREDLQQLDAPGSTRSFGVFDEGPVARATRRCG